MEIIGDDIIFSTGKKVYVNGGIIGIDPEFDISGGYDQGIYSSEANCEELSKVELIELADFMVLQWQAFKESVR